jgi:aryl-alcohol dehydrogenase-like predicted oxidoreductase
MIARLDVVGSTVAISKIGFGCAGIHAGSEIKRSVRLIEAALAAGIRHFDTAPVYGAGQSEDVLGQVLSGVADITLSTKVGIARPSRKTARDSAAVTYRRFVKPLLTHMPRVNSQLGRLRAGIVNRGVAPVLPRRTLQGHHIRRELGESLKRLRRDRVDLYLVHEPDQFELDEALETFLDLRREGVIGAFVLAYGHPFSKRQRPILAR